MGGGGKNAEVLPPEVRVNGHMCLQRIKEKKKSIQNYQTLKKQKLVKDGECENRMGADCKNTA